MLNSVLYLGDLQTLSCWSQDSTLDQCKATPRLHKKSGLESNHVTEEKISLTEGSRGSISSLSYNKISDSIKLTSVTSYLLTSFETNVINIKLFFQAWKYEHFSVLFYEGQNIFLKFHKIINIEAKRNTLSTFNYKIKSKNRFAKTFQSSFQPIII